MSNLRKFSQMIILASILSGCGSTSSNETATQSAPSTPQAAEAQPKQMHIGDELKLDNMSFKITKAVASKKVGTNAFFSKKAEEGSEYIIVSYKMKNISKEPKTVVADPFKLKSKDGTTFEPDAEAQTALIADGKQTDIGIAQMSPGITKSRQAVFQVPDTAKPAEMTLVIASDELLSGTEPVEVVLR